MPEYLAPAVYVEEIDSGNKPIEGVSTSTAGMIGVHRARACQRADSRDQLRRIRALVRRAAESRRFWRSLLFAPRRRRVFHQRRQARFYHAEWRQAWRGAERALSCTIAAAPIRLPPCCCAPRPQTRARSGIRRSVDINIRTASASGGRRSWIRLGDDSDAEYRIIDKSEPGGRDHA